MVECMALAHRFGMALTFNTMRTITVNYWTDNLLKLNEKSDHSLGQHYMLL